MSMSSFDAGSDAQARDAEGKFAATNTPGTDSVVLDHTPDFEDVEPGGSLPIYAAGNHGDGNEYTPPDFMDSSTEIRLERDEDGNLTVEVDKWVDDFEVVEERAYPGYCSDRQALIESYARQQWGAELDDACDWDHQLMTFSRPIEAARFCDVDRAMVSMSDFAQPSPARYGMESVADESTLFKLQEHLDHCDAQSVDVMTQIHTRQLKGEFSGADIDVTKLQGDFRDHMAAMDMKEIPGSSTGTDYGKTVDVPLRRTTGS